MESSYGSTYPAGGVDGLHVDACHELDGGRLVGVVTVTDHFQVVDAPVVGRLREREKKCDILTKTMVVLFFFLETPSFT